MGYTHYWGFKKPAKNTAEKTEILYKKTVLECQKVIKYYYKENGGLSGYSAHTKLGQYGGINLNGKGDQGHETFILREHYNQNEGDFCKTARKDYDIVVVACLAILSYRMGHLISVESDGYSHEHIAGIQLDERVLNRKIMNNLMRNKKSHPINDGELLRAV